MSSDLVSRLLEAIEAKERSAHESGPARIGWATYRDENGQMLYTSPVAENGDVWVTAGSETEPTSVQVVYDPSSVLRRCDEDRALVDWYVGWQETFRGPIPEGHTEEGALHFRMASEFVFNRLLASYGIDWADDGGITEEET
jgi:hypothetical protein